VAPPEPGLSRDEATPFDPELGPDAGGRCRFVDEQGRRCTARHGLEFHHRHPVAMGGDHSPQAMALACKAHNLLLAEVDYGRAAVARHRQSNTG
jgi:hypothetical protein